MAIKPLIVSHTYTAVVPLPLVKSPITYIDQAIVYVDDMIGCANICSVDEVIAFITMDNTANIPVTPDFSGKRVNNYYDVIRICYGLSQQR